MKVRFPVTKLDYSIPDKGIHVARHGTGNAVAQCHISFNQDSRLKTQDSRQEKSPDPESGVLSPGSFTPTLSQLVMEKDADQDQMDRAEKTRTWIEEGLKLLIRYADDARHETRNAEASFRTPYPESGVLSLVSFINGSSTISLEFLADHDCILTSTIQYSEIQGSRRKTRNAEASFRTPYPESGVLSLESSSFQCDINVADEIGDEYVDGIAPLYALGFMHQSSLLFGADEKIALNNTITLYEHLNDNDREALIKTLSHPQIDAGNVFLRFLQNSVHKPQQEKDRLIAWLRGRSQIDLPYDDRDVIRALEEETDLAALRLRIYNAINDTYDQTVDTENANRIADACSEKGMRIVAGRFSRALYLDVMLMANASVIETARFRESIFALDELVRSSSLDFDAPQLKGKMPRDFSRIRGEMQVLINLAAEKQVSQAQIEGALSKFKKALRGFETGCLEALDTGYSMLDAGYSMLDTGYSMLDTGCLMLDAGIEERTSELMKFRKQIRDKVDDIFQEVSRAEASCLTAPSREPVFLIFLQRIHPLDAINMGTLNQLVDPFFGEDEEVHELMRGCGHIMYTTANLRGWLRKCDDWIEALPAYASYEIIPQAFLGKKLEQKNLWYTVSTHVWRAILEEMYKQHAEDWAVNIEEVMATEHIALSREMLVAGRDARPPDDNISGEEAIIEIIKRESLEEHVAELAALIEAIYIDRCDQVARRVEKQKISRLDALKQMIEDDKILPSDFREGLLAAIRERGLDERVEELKKLATRPRRDLPNVHVLTTLGPGETENVENWLEESMALFNVSRAYNLEDTSVQERISDYKNRIYQLGEKLVDEMDLEGDLYNIMQTEGLADREAGIMRLIGTYPEVAAKVAGLAVQMEKQDSSVQNYLRDHLPERLGKVTARREVIAENGLSKELENPRFRYESHGPFKKYNLLYTPSRVDLGIDEVESVKNVPKWIGGRDRQAANAGRSLYGLYNLAGPTAMPATKFAEFLKVGENFFSRGGVFYLSLAAGANLDALKIGDFEFFRDQWNMRGDRIVLPTGETYGGFCVPKEFTLLYSIILAALDPKTSKEVLNAFEVPEDLHASLMDDLRNILRERSEFDSMLDWEKWANSYLADRLMTKGGHTASELPPRLARLATTLESKGLIAGENEDDVVMNYQLAGWINKKAHGLEEVNRSGPFRKVHLIYRLVREARKKNPDVAPDNKIIGIMSAPYKEGGRKEGKDVPISDVRFGAGARKLEIYAGTAERNLLKHIDPEGRGIIKGMFRSFQPPADIRIVGTCTAADILNHVPGSGLEAIAENIEQRLLEAGLSQDIIDANCQIYGGDLERWVDVKEMPDSQREALINEIGANIHLLVLVKRGVFLTYKEAVQGVDFIDLGIPDPELLDLVDDLPRLLHLMRRGRPNSALVFADGTSGARRRTFSFRYSSSKRKVKELFALDDRAIYGATGLGSDTVESWRQEMVKERQYAQDLLDSIISGRYEKAQEIYSNIIEYVRQEGKAEEAAHEEIMAGKFKVLSEDYRYISESLGKVKAGLPLEQLDFGTWVILGGMYVLNGKMSADKIAGIRSQFESSIPATGDRAIVDRIVERFVRPEYEPLAEVQLYREVDTGISGSLKAAEEKVGRLQKLEARRRETARAVARTKRREAFELALKEAESCPPDMELLYGKALGNVGDGRSSISHESFGRFIAWARAAFSAVGADVNVRPVSNMFAEMEIADETYMALASDLAQLAVSANGDRKFLEDIAQACELLDIMLVIEKTLDAESPEEMTIAIARFFDATINNHIFDYIPYHYHKQRGDGFESYTREEKMDLAVRRHRWLYTYTRHKMTTETELSDLGSEYHDAWLGDADRAILGLGVNLEHPREQFWFSYARLRDAVVLKHEGYEFPRIFTDLDPDVLRCNERSNVVIVYPHGNTTVPVALEQGAKLEQSGINLMLCAFPYIEHDEKYGRKVLKVSDGFMYVSASQYKAALEASGKAEEEHQGSDKRGILIATRFREPIIAHGIFFHFTHPMRPEIESVAAPLIQPVIWEAATHLKCRLPDMLKGSGVRTADQINWYKDQTADLPEDEARKQIRKALHEFAETHTQVIAKPEKESGGRMAKILPVRQGGQFLEENIGELADVVYTISRVDNVAIQDVIPSHVRRLYSEEFLEDMVDRFARIGVPVLLDREPRTPLYSYFRQVVALGKDGYEITHHITVISTRGIANVGQGGILYEYRDEIINPRYREDMRREITRAALSSLESQRVYTKEHWQEILEEYLQIHPEFADKVKITEPGADLTGFSDADIPYEMGDYMPVFLVDRDDNLVRVFDTSSEELVPLFHEDGSPKDVEIYDENGHPAPRVDGNGAPVPIPMFDAEGNRIARFNRDGNPISTLLMFKIEPNPGAGLWRPHNDQLPEERKGEGVFKIFKCLGERAEVYRDRLNQLAGL